jgi:beta-galactosidase
MSNDQFRFGADYYPEHWPEERWAEDARLMSEAGFNVVRLAEFAWSLMEPQEGRFDFSWLDRAIELLSASDIQIVLGTPTAAPPPWIMVKQEDLFIVREDGSRVTYGLRREYCPNNPLYHQYTQRIVSEMAEHYKDHPAVIGWQIDNEFGNRCFCNICRGEFHKWLKGKYEHLEVLNDAWGTIFWSQIYTEWSQIPVPLVNINPDTPAHNPGLHLDYNRFQSDSYCKYQDLQINIIRGLCPDHFITHNLMGFKYGNLNYFDLAENLDFVSWDNYVRMMWDMGAKVDPTVSAIAVDTMRGLKKKNIWVMEQQSGGGGWNMVAVPPKPGELRLWSYQTIGHGADAVIYFRWRTCRTGTEQYWQGILEHHGIPGRRYEEVARVGQELKTIGAIISGSEVRPQAAIMHSYDTRFAFQIQPNNPRFGYKKHIQDIYGGFHTLNIPVDMISEKDSLAGYKLVFVPAMYVLSEETTANLERFTSSGGVVVFTPRTGVKDEVNKVVNLKLPGLAAKLAGVEVEEYVSMPVDEDSEVQFGLPDLEDEFAASVWADVLRPTTAKVVARYTKDYYAGEAAATINLFDHGKVVTLGTMGDAAYYEAVVRWITGLAGISSLMDTPKGVEVAERWRGDQRILFILNHTGQEQDVQLDRSYTNMLDEKVIEGTLNIPPLDLMVMTERR